MKFAQLRVRFLGQYKCSQGVVDAQMFEAGNIGLDELGEEHQIVPPANVQVIESLCKLLTGFYDLGLFYHILHFR